MPELAQEAAWSPNSAPAILTVAAETLAGELAGRKGEYEKVIAHLDKAVRLQEALTYVDPSDWNCPVRHSLSTLLLYAGCSVAAEVVYWEDLRGNSENARTIAKEKDQAKAMAAHFRKLWAGADVTLTASRF